jgi:hypothetical protein
MALKMDIELDNKIQVKDAYVKIAGFIGTKESISFSVIAFNIVDDVKYLVKNMNPKGYEGYIIPFELEPEYNIIKQCYEYLKTLPEFSEAIDC